VGPVTGEEVPIGPAGTDGVGRVYHLPPGASVKLPIAFGDLSSVPDGTYNAVACVPQLALASQIGTVTVTSGDGPLPRLPPSHHPTPQERRSAPFTCHAGR
jgi:hypothetical protein